MNKITAWLKSIRLDRLLTVFMATLLLLVSTACSTRVLAKTADEVRPEVPEGAVTSPKTGGMNEYSDVDPRFNPSGAQVKAKELVENAQKNIDEKSIDSPQQYVENYRSGTPLGERTRRIGEDLGEATENVGKDLTKGAQKNAEKGKAKSEEAAQSVKQNTQKVADDTAAKGEDLGNIGNKLQRTAQDTADTVKSNVNKAQRALDDVADD